MIQNLQSLIDKLLTYQKSAPLFYIRIQLPETVIGLKSPSEKLISTLEHYFSAVTTQQAADIELLAFDSEDTALQNFLPASEVERIIAASSWQDWQREGGKSGRKEAKTDDSYQNSACRWVYKVKTGMLLCQFTESSATPSLAFGKVNQHPNQIINFMLTQFLNQQQRQNGVLGHAAGIELRSSTAKVGLAIAGLSGGGKSTLMLKLLDEDGAHFISNDRLVFSTDDKQIAMQGIPKQPRINPGTIVHNPRLYPMMAEEEREQYLALPSEELRGIEKKYDAFVDQLYRDNCLKLSCELDLLVILNWSPTSTEETHLHQTTLNQSPHLAAAIMKSPGVFFSDASGEFIKNGQSPDIKATLALLGEVACLELKGKIDFEQASKLIKDYITSNL